MVSVPISASSLIEETYCIPWKDIRLGFTSNNLSIQTDRDNMLLSIYKHPNTLRVEQLQQVTQPSSPQLNSTHTQTHTILQDLIHSNQLIKEGEGMASSNFWKFEVASVEVQTEVFGDWGQMQGLKAELQAHKTTVQMMYADNVALIDIKSEHQSMIHCLNLNITQLQTRIQKISTSTQQLLSVQSMDQQQGFKVHSQEEREEKTLAQRDVGEGSMRSSGSAWESTKNVLGSLKLKEIESLQEQNKLLRNFIQSKKAKTHLSIEEVEVLELSELNLQEVDQNPALFLETSRTQRNNNHNITRLETENRKLVSQLKSLHTQLDTEKEFNSLLKSQNQQVYFELSQCQTLEDRSSLAAHRQLIEANQLLQKELNNSESVVTGLRDMTREYRSLLDSMIKMVTKGEDSQEMVKEYTTILDERIRHLETLIKDTVSLTSQDGEFERLMIEFKKELNKRIVAQGKVERLAQALIEYEKEIMEKTTRISDLNLALIDIEHNNSLVSYIQENSLRQRFPERSGHARTMSHFDRVAEEMNVSEEHTIIDSKSRSLISSSLLAESKDLRRPCTQSLKQLLHQNILPSKQKHYLILQLVHTIQKDVSLWQQPLTPSHILIHPDLNIDINTKTHRVPKQLDSLYCSPQEVYNTLAETSIVWRLGIIIDQIIHCSLFFPSVDSLTNPKTAYKFRFTDPQYSGIKRILEKAIIKNSNLRMGMAKMLTSLKLQYRGKQQ